MLTSGSKCYSSTQSDVQALVNEVKSKSATLNILMEELKYVSVNEGARKPIGMYADKLKSGPNPCGKCAQSESQLQAALDELNSVKPINNTLHEEIKSLTQSSYEVSNDINSWTIAKPSRSATTYLFTPWCRVLLEKLTGLQLVKKFPAFHGTRRLITALTSVRHLSLS